MSLDTVDEVPKLTVTPFLMLTDSIGGENHLMSAFLQPDNKRLGNRLQSVDVKQNRLANLGVTHHVFGFE